MPKFYLLVGPSGVGKSRIQEKIVSPEGLEHIVRSISATTRKPRKEEKDGVDYFFLDKKTFLEKARNNEFLEFKEYLGKYYGTPKEFVKRNIQLGNSVVGVIEVKGARAVIAYYEQMAKRDKLVIIFVYPERFSDLVMHLEARDIKLSYSASKSRMIKNCIKERMSIALNEIEFINEADYRVCMRHNMFDDAFNQIRSIIIAEHNHEKVTSRYLNRFRRDWTAFHKSY